MKTKDQYVKIKLQELYGANDLEPMVWMAIFLYFFLLIVVVPIIYDDTNKKKELNNKKSNDSLSKHPTKAARNLNQTPTSDVIKIEESTAPPNNQNKNNMNFPCWNELMQDAIDRELPFLKEVSRQANCIEQGENKYQVRRNLPSEGEVKEEADHNKKEQDNIKQTEKEYISSSQKKHLILALISFVYLVLAVLIIKMRYKPLHSVNVDPDSQKFYEEEYYYLKGLINDMNSYIADLYYKEKGYTYPHKRDPKQYNNNQNHQYHNKNMYVNQPNNPNLQGYSNNTNPSKNNFTINVY
jgi:hypothetical protein